MDWNVRISIPLSLFLLAKRYTCKAESAAMAVVALFCRMDVR